MIKKLLPFLFILVLSFFAYKPLLHSGFFPMHDDTQVVRVNEMTVALKDGMFPVRWSKDLGYGYGYPIFNFYNPVPYYIGGFLEIISNDALFSTKLLFFLAIIISAFSSYLFGKEFYGKAGGLITSVFYVYAPYHAVDIYVRGALAEAFAYAFLPFLFLFVYKIYQKQNFINLILLSLSFAFVICSHNLTALIVFPFLIFFMVYFFFKSKTRKLLLYFLSSLGLGLAVSAFYFIPAILEMNFTNVISQVGGGADFRDHFVCLSQLWTSPWGYGGSAKGCSDGLSFMIGKYHIIILALISLTAAASIFLNKISQIYIKQKEEFKIILLFTAFFLASTFMTLTFSKSIWEFFSPLSYVQYPWRFLSLSLLFASLIIGSIPIFLRPFIKKKVLDIIIFVLLVFIVFVSAKFFIPQKYINVTSQNYLNDYEVKWVTSKISDEYMPKNFQKPKNYYQIPDPNNLITKQISVVIVKRKTQDIELSVIVTKPASYVFPVAYFPSWKAFVDSKEVSINPTNKGMSVYLSEGKHSVRFKFIQGMEEKISSLISLTGILAIFAGIILLRRKIT